MKSKRINKSGGLTIPSDIRRDLGFDAGSAVDLSVEGGKVVIEAHTPRCSICDSVEDLIVYKDKRFCKGCITEMGKEANN